MPRKYIFKVTKESRMPRSTIVIGYYQAYSKAELREYLNKHDIHFSGIEVIMVHDIEEVVVK